MVESFTYIAEGLTWRIFRACVEGVRMVWTRQRMQRSCSVSEVAAALVLLEAA